MVFKKKRGTVPMHELERDHYLFTEQIRLLYKNTPLSLLAVVINSFILSILLRKHISHSVLIIWLFAMLFTAGFRYLTILRYRKFININNPRLPFISNIYLFGIALSGILWGSSVKLLFPADSISHQVFLAFVLGGMVAGSLALYSIKMKAFLVFSIPILIPLNLVLFIQGNEGHVAMGTMILVFSVVMIIGAKHMNSIWINSIQSNLEKDRLFKRMTEEKTRAEQLNYVLENELVEGTKIREELRDRTELYLDLFENANDMIQSIDPSGRFIYVNKTWKKAMGYTEEELKGLIIFDIIDPEYVDHCREIFGSTLTGEENRNIETVFIAKNGDKILVEGSINCRIENGIPVATRGIFRDVTQRKQYEDALRESSAIIKNILDTAGDAVISIDEKGIIEIFNRAAEMFFGYKAEEIISRNVSILMPEPYRSEHDKYLKNYLENNVKKTMGKTSEVDGQRKNGEIFPISLSLSEVYLQNKRIFTAIARDVTQLKEYEKALHQARLEAEAANHAKSEFLASMSHEIRTPMNAIIGMAELLVETELNPDQREYVRVFRTAGENLLHIINDILDISKVEAGKIELEKTRFNLRDLAGSVMEIMAMRAHEKDIDLTCEISEDVPSILTGDPSRLRQIIINLVGNAIKFTETGEVAIKICTEQEPDEKSPEFPDFEDENGFEVKLRFSVRDTGIGIPLDKQDYIFDKFSQADTSTTREFGGTGLGLAISRKLVQLMGGKIWVESEEGKGSIFSFTSLFMAQSDRRSLARDLAPDEIKGLRILVADNDNINRMIVTRTLTRWGMSVTGAESGRFALEKLEKAYQNGEPYEFLILECRMHDMDGFEVLSRIGASGYLSDIPVIMLTSEKQKGDFLRAKRLGIRRYLAKPLKTDDLKKAVFNTMEDIKHEGQRESILTQGTISLGNAPMNILLADDSSDNRLLIKAHLKKTDHRVDIAENGLEAVEKFMSNRYDLVFMDVQMPVMDGYTATKRIRQWERENHTGETPIVALTAHAMKEDEQKSYDAGCNAHVTKPIEKSVLMAVIERFAGLRALSGNQVRENTELKDSQNDSHGIKSFEVEIDEGLKDLIPGYLDGRRRDIDMMSKYLENEDYENIRITGHTMKGSGGGYGFDAVTRIGASIEIAAKEKDTVKIKSSMDDLNDFLTYVSIKYI